MSDVPLILCMCHHLRRHHLYRPMLYSIIIAKFSISMVIIITVNILEDNKDAHSHLYIIMRLSYKVYQRVSPQQRGFLEIRFTYTIISCASRIPILSINSVFFEGDVASMLIL